MSAGDKWVRLGWQSLTLLGSGVTLVVRVYALVDIWAISMGPIGLPAIGPAQAYAAVVLRGLLAMNYDTNLHRSRVSLWLDGAGGEVGPRAKCLIRWIMVGGLLLMWWVARSILLYAVTP